MQRKFVSKFALMGLTLLLSGCGSATVSVIPKDCLFDFPIQPSDADLDIMQGNAMIELAMRIDEHDQLYENNCEGED